MSVVVYIILIDERSVGVVAVTFLYVAICVLLMLFVFVELYSNIDHQDATGTGSYPRLNVEMRNIGAICGTED